MTTDRRPYFAIRYSLFAFVGLLAALAAVLWLAEAAGRRAPAGSAGLTFSPPGGAYERTLLVEMHPSQPGAPIIFTTNGTVPTTTVGTLYERPVRLDAGLPGVTVLRAREIVNGAPGPVHSASYVVGVKHRLPILSLIADPADLWDPAHGILANPGQRGQDWERPVFMTLVEADVRPGFVVSRPGGEPNGFEIGAGLRVDGDAESGLRLAFRAEYGATRLVYPLFPNHRLEVPSYNGLVLQQTGMLESQLLVELAAQVGGEAAQGRFVWLVVNGEPWGVYRLSERVDRSFVQDRLGLASADLLRDGQALAGDAAAWEALMNWLVSHDPRDPLNWAELETRIDVAGLTDYLLLHDYLGMGGLLAVYPRDGAGRWTWLYDGGLTEAFLPQGDALTQLRDRLLENPAYQARFVRRAADLLNMVLAPEVVEGVIGRLVNWELVNWELGRPLGGEWDVAALRELARRRPDEMRQELAARFDLSATVPITFNVAPPEGGGLVVNGWTVPAPTWRGDYFVGSQLELIPVPAPGYQSTNSQFTNFPIPNSPLTLTARFVPLPAGDPGLTCPGGQCQGRPNDVIINEYWINDDSTRYNSIGGRPIEGDWLELLVTRPRGVDLRGWRITDNDSQTATGEGSLILPHLEALAAVPRGTAILILAAASADNAARFPDDDLDPSDGQMVFYVGNGRLDVSTDPGFGIGTEDDNLVLLAPGPGPGFADDIGVDFVAEGHAVTPLSFGVLADGVIFDAPFTSLGRDDGALFTGQVDNDHGGVSWIVDPGLAQSGDDPRPGATNILTPGALNYGQDRLIIPLWVIGAPLVGLAGVVLLWRARRRARS